MPAVINTVDRPHDMRSSEVGVICSLIKEGKFSKRLEVGMANGSSSVSMLAVLSANGGGSLTSIDPYQLAAPASVKNDNDDGYSGEGLGNVQRAGCSHTG